MMFFFTTQSIFVSRERHFLLLLMPFWLLPLFIAVVTVAVFVACSYGLGFLSISKVPFYQQAWLFGMSLGTRFIINDPSSTSSSGLCCHRSSSRLKKTVQDTKVLGPSNGANQQAGHGYSCLQEHYKMN